ncbi:MAG TPA: transposase [Anaerolineales bacterium]|nr:transposase [Anaerolineales bacterium]
MDFHRYYIPGTAVFITQVVEGRQPAFQDSHYIELLSMVIQIAKRYYPFELLAYVYLPDHFHILIQPSEGITFSQIMHSIKANFTKAYKAALGLTIPLKFWQKRFWDHVIRDDCDMANHLNYIHFNPVKHGLIDDPAKWPYTSYSLWIERGLDLGTHRWMEPADHLWGE